MESVNVTSFIQQRQIGKSGRRKRKHVESFLEQKGLTSLINKDCSLSGHCRSTFNMEFSPDGTKVASTHGDHTVRVTDIATGKCVRTLTGHPRTPWCLAYHPSSSHILASGCLNGQVRIWDLYGHGCEVWNTDSSSPIASMTFHPVDHVLVFASGKTIYFWDWSRPEPFAQCTTKFEYERIRWVKFDPTGQVLYTGISNNTAARREDASRVSLMSQRGRTEAENQQPERLTSLYNNLLNRFHEYRQEQVSSQVQSSLRQEPAQSTSNQDSINEVEMYPGVSDGDIVRPTSPEHAQMLSDARQYAAEATRRASEAFNRRVAQATRRATEIGLQELTRRPGGISEAQAIATQHATELTQQATGRLRFDSAAVGLRLQQYAANSHIRTTEGFLQDSEARTGPTEEAVEATQRRLEGLRQRLQGLQRVNYNPFENIDSELEDHARQAVASAVERIEQRHRQAVEVRERAQRCISEFNQLVGSSDSGASCMNSFRQVMNNINMEDDGPNVDGSVRQSTHLEDNSNSLQDNTEESGEIDVEDIEINISNDSYDGNNSNFDPESFITENYDAELNNVLGIDIDHTVTETNNVDADLTETVELNTNASEPFSLNERTTAAVDAGLNEQEINSHSAINTALSDRTGIDIVESNIIQSDDGRLSPPNRCLSSVKLMENINVGGQEQPAGSSGEKTSRNEAVNGKPKQNNASHSEEKQPERITSPSNLQPKNCFSEPVNKTFNEDGQEHFNQQSLQEQSLARRLDNIKQSDMKPSNTTAGKGPVTLLQYLQSKVTTQMSSIGNDSKPSTALFPSIRERLQTKIPLTSCDNASRSSSVRFLPSRGEIPVVTVVSASDCSTTTSSVLEQSRPLTASWTDRCSTNGANTRAGLCLAVNTTNVQSGLHCSSTVSNAALAGLNYSPIVPTVIASTSSQASLFQNIYLNSRGTHSYSTRGSSGGGQMRNTNLSRTHPYLQNRSRFLSLMEPYLESRGVALNQTDESNADNTAVVNETAPSLRSRPMSYSEVQIRSGGGHSRSSVLNSTAQSNTHESSDTESELNTHFHNRAYFLPISEDQTRTLSSTSVQSISSVESSDNIILRQRSMSRDSVESVTGNISVSEAPSSSVAEDFVQDLQMHRFSRSGTVARQQNNLQSSNENLTLNQDDNNNTIQVSAPSSNWESAGERPESYVVLRDNLVSMTDRIEQEMSELNRRINALRDNFNQSLLALRQDRERYQNLGRSLTETSTNLIPLVRPDRLENSSREDNSNGPDAVPVIRVSGLEGISYPNQPPTLLETSLRSHNRQRLVTNNLTDPQEDGVENIEPQHWRMLQRHYLHPHYSRSILDETINRPNNAIQSAINRAIAGAFMGTGDSAVANNIINQTHRIQFWDFTKLDIPDITNASQNIVVAHCKLHNDASCDISQDGTLLATFVPSHHGFPDDNILAVYSLVPSSRGQCMYTKSFGPNAISISISPRNNFVMVGLAAKHLSWVFIRNQLVAQIYKFEKENAGEKSMKHVTDVFHPCDPEIRMHVSGNAAKWLPTPGHGLIYGTNRGHLRLCRPFCMVKIDKTVGEKEDGIMLSTSRGPMSRRNLMRMLGLSNSNLPRTISISTQTNTRGIRQHSGTQTDNSDSD